MPETVIEDTPEYTVIETTADGDPGSPGWWRSVRTEWKDGTTQKSHQEREARLAAAVATLRQWADDADAVTVTQGNAVQTLQVVVDRVGVFFDRFADLLETQYGER